MNPPLLKGGQGREPEHLANSGTVLSWIALASLGWLLVYCLWRWF